MFDTLKLTSHSQSLKHEQSVVFEALRCVKLHTGAEIGQKTLLWISEGLADET
jgi:hypothetical protein